METEHYSEDMLIELWDKLLKYDYSNLTINYRTPVIGAPFDIQGYYSDAFRYDALINDIETAITNGRVVILSGPTRSGKSTIGKIWQGNNQNRTLIDLDSISEAEIPRESEMFIDEVRSNKLELVLELQKGRKLVLSTRIEFVRQLEQELNNNGINTEVIIIPLLTPEQMINYISKLTQLDQEDDLIKSIAQLSGGSIYIANNLYNCIAEYALEMLDENDGNINQEILVLQTFTQFIRIMNNYLSICIDSMRQVSPEDQKYIPQTQLLLEFVSFINKQKIN